MARKPNLSALAALGLVAALAAPLASADAIADAAQDQPTGTMIPADKDKEDIRVFDALVVTGATTAAADQRWSDAGDDLPEIADADWQPAN